MKKMENLSIIFMKANSADFKNVKYTKSKTTHQFSYSILVSSDAKILKYMLIVFSKIFKRLNESQQGIS